ncbi:MAG TPA: 2-hydroxychromene-2-carboxylate isomerase [Pseudomonadales bacterium]|nr:2-hydroxychromene-2-carboxylate isomerase [Pseudomonadales bacterium]
MALSIDFYFDFGSPTAYLAYQRLQQLKSVYDFELNYKPMLLGAVFKATQNASPVTIPAKGAYMMKHDLPRFVKRYGVEFNMNPFFPINTLALMRGAHAAIQANCFETYCEAVYNAIWRDGKNMGDVSIVKDVLQQAGLNADKLLAAIETPEIKQALVTVTDEAVQRGVFGAPTLFIGEEMFFGQDRMDFIEARLAEHA